MSPIQLAPGAVPLAAWREVYRGAAVALDPAAYAIDRSLGPGGLDHPGQRRAGLWHQHRLRQARQRAHRGRRPREAAAQHRAVACRGRRPADAGCRRPVDDGAQAREPRPGRVGRAGRDRAPARGPARQGPDAGGAVPGLGRRLGRSRAARPHVGDADRRRLVLHRRRGGSRRAGAGRGRPVAGGSRRQGRPCPAERHAVLDRLCAGRAVRDRDAVRLGAGDRRALDRCGARLRCAVRSAHPRAAPPRRPDRGGRMRCVA